MISSPLARFDPTGCPAPATRFGDRLLGGLSSVTPATPAPEEISMPPAKNSTPLSAQPNTFREPAALKWLSTSLDAAQRALVELRADAGRDLSHGARDLHKDRRTFISNARRDTGKLTKALQRDFEHAQEQLGQSTSAAGQARVKTTTAPASPPEPATNTKRSTAQPSRLGRDAPGSFPSRETASASLLTWLLRCMERGSPRQSSAVALALGPNGPAPLLLLATLAPFSKRWRPRPEARCDGTYKSGADNRRPGSAFRSHPWHHGRSRRDWLDGCC